MRPTGKRDQYQAIIPAEHVLPKWDLMYFVEVIDKKGNEKIYPRPGEGGALYRRQVTVSWFRGMFGVPVWSSPFRPLQAA
jgi:hypothetical protein